jgi:hypothetical protein
MKVAHQQVHKDLPLFAVLSQMIVAYTQLS